MGMDLWQEFRNQEYKNIPDATTFDFILCLYELIDRFMNKHEEEYDELIKQGIYFYGEVSEDEALSIIPYCVKDRELHAIFWSVDYFCTCSDMKICLEHRVVKGRTKYILSIDKKYR